MSSLAEDLALGFKKECPKCGIIKARDKFRFDERSSNGLSNYCRECIQKSGTRGRALVSGELSQREIREIDIWRRIEALGFAGDKLFYKRVVDGDADRRAGRKRRALKFGAYHEPYTELEILERWGTDCHVCGGAIDFHAKRGPYATASTEDSLHVEHLIPLSEGGDDTLDNVRPSHGKCNYRKNAAALRATGRSEADKKAAARAKILESYSQETRDLFGIDF